MTELEVTRLQRNTYADECAMLVARCAELERQLEVYKAIGRTATPIDEGHPVPEDGGFWTPPADEVFWADRATGASGSFVLTNDETGPIAP